MGSIRINAQHSLFQVKEKSTVVHFVFTFTLPFFVGDAFGVGQLVQVEHGTHLVDLTVALADDAIVVADHHVAEILVEGFGLRQPEAQAQLEQTLWPQVSQSKSLSHDIFKPPVRSLFLVGFRQIQIVLPDILQRGRDAPMRKRGKGETKQSLSLFECQKRALCAD